MSDKKDGGPAFPVIDEYNNIQAHGMTLRDYFAGRALSFLKVTEGCPPTSAIAKVAYAIADAMLAERDK